LAKASNRWQVELLGGGTAALLQEVNDPVEVSGQSAQLRDGELERLEFVFG